MPCRNHFTLKDVTVKRDEGGKGKKEPGVLIGYCVIYYTVLCKAKGLLVWSTP